MENQTTPCKALVLAGGGARGSYQVGVWKALMELDWHPQIITGTSAVSYTHLTLPTNSSACLVGSEMCIRDRVCGAR